jgi:hypothetical protein
VRFAYDRWRTRGNGKPTMIENILYVPVMKNNLLSLGQLTQKELQIVMKDNMLQRYDAN